MGEIAICLKATLYYPGGPVNSKPAPYLQGTAVAARRSSPSPPLSASVYIADVSRQVASHSTRSLFSLSKKVTRYGASETLSPSGAVFTWKLVLAACS